MRNKFVSRQQKAKAELELRKRRREREANIKPFDLLDLTLATHPNYDPGWFHKQLCRKLDDFLIKVENKESPRLIVNVPPQHGKSTLVSETFPVRILAAHPDWHVIVASYASSLAEKFSRRARDLVRHEFIKNNAPHLILSKDRQGVEEWETTLRGGYKAVGVLGSITGSPANIFVIDDPLKDYEEAYSQVIRDKIYETYQSVIETRLAPGGGLIVTQTRWHEDDLTGRLMKEEADRWDQLVFKAISEKDEEFRKAGEALHPERYTLEYLQRRKSKGGWWWNALYQQMPVAAEGGMLKRNWWKLYNSAPQEFDEIIFSVDAAFKESKKSDYVVLQVWGRIGEKAYLLDQIREQLDFNRSCNALLVLYSNWPKVSRILIEDKANGPAIISSMKIEMPFASIIGVNPHGGKEARVAAVSPKVQAGDVYLPEFAAYTKIFIDECASFPKGANDDQVDAMSQALTHLFVMQETFGVF